MVNELILKNTLNHFRVICKHKYYVFKNCLVAGMPLRGLFHDMSKFSPTEFIEGVRYYQGTDSPINACKKDKGYSEAWLHHRGRNPHHYEFWEDNFDNGGEALQMPFKYALELVCDSIGAGQAYNGDKFTYKGEYEWWLNRIKKPIAIHPQTKLFVTYILKGMAKMENNKLLRPKYSKHIYDLASEKVRKESTTKNGK